MPEIRAVSLTRDYAKSPRVLKVVPDGLRAALKAISEGLSLDPPFVDWWTLFGFNTGGGRVGRGVLVRARVGVAGWWVVGGLSTAGLSGVRQVLV